MANYTCKVKCFVPGCDNSSQSTPEKIFFNVPRDIRRNSWCEAVGRTKSISATAPYRCCQDHFDVENDCYYWDWCLQRLQAGCKVDFQLKENVLPRPFCCYNEVEEDANAGENSNSRSNVLPNVFDCQPDRRTAYSTAEGSAVSKRKRKGLLDDALVAGPSKKSLCDVPACAEGAGELIDGNLEQFENVSTHENQVPPVAPEEIDQLVKDFGVQVKIKPELTMALNVVSEMIEQQPGHGKICFSTLKVQSNNVEEKTENLHKKGQRIRIRKFDQLYSYSQGSSSSPGSSQTIKNASQKSAEQDYEKAHRMETMQELSLQLMNEKSRKYLGIPERAKGVIPLIVKYTKLSEQTILLVLRRIRMHESYSTLADHLNLSESTISRSINNAVPLLAAYLKSFIFWPENSIIQSNVPTAFRANYSKVVSIIDCFEIQIEKPTDALIQSLTWSSYKDCNTVKYLIGATPAGQISFISPGFGGRTSDQDIVKHSGFLTHLKSGDEVMADRGFKHVDQVLSTKGCKLVRPPSVKNNTIMSKKDVRDTKVIASLRVHIERIIKRLREFAHLGPHACFHHESMAVIDGTVVIACALANLQPPIAV